MKAIHTAALTIGSIVLVGVFLTGGYFLFGSHTSTDNEGNFRSIFGFPRPAEVKVYHSEVWEGRHMLLAESSWHIELDAPEEFVDRLISKGSGAFTREPDAIAHERDSTLPSWFAPKLPEAYEQFDTEDGNGSLFIDKQTRRVFLYRNDF